MIEDFTETRHMIFAKHVYHVSYNKDTGEYSCDCIGFRVHHTCKHIKEFKNYLEKIKDKTELYK